MRHATPVAAPNPFDVRAMWNPDRMPFAFGGDTTRAWLDGATRLQTAAGAFLTERLGKDVAALTAFGAAATPAAAVELQLRYLRDALADYFAEGQRMLEVIGDVAQAGGMTIPAGGGWGMPDATHG